ADIITGTKFCPVDPPTQFAGDATFYTAGVGSTFACSYTYQAIGNAYAAMNSADYDSNVAVCGACIRATCPTGGSPVTAMIIDRCPGCTGTHGVDFSQPIFQ